MGGFIMFKRTWARLAVVGSGAALVVGSMAGVSNAAGDSIYKAYAGNDIGCGAYGEFQSEGEIFELWDTCKDDHSVYIRYCAGADYSDCEGGYNRRGANTMEKFNESYAEGTKIKFKVCVTEGYRDVYCGSYTYGTA